jgi:hypothetical protein
LEEVKALIEQWREEYNHWGLAKFVQAGTENDPRLRELTNINISSSKKHFK